MNTREEFNWNPIFAIGIVIIILFLTILVFQGKITPDGFIVGSGTFLLAMATFYLAQIDRTESRFNREQDRELAEKDRRRLRLKEQLEGLYSPLMSYINILENIETHKVEPFFSIIQNFKGKFEFLAEDDLKDLLREYYNTDLRSISKDEWEKLIYPIMDAIGIGCVDISLEYDDLTRKVT